MNYFWAEEKSRLIIKNSLVVDDTGTCKGISIAYKILRIKLHRTADLSVRKEYEVFANKGIELVKNAKISLIYQKSRALIIFSDLPWNLAIL